MPREQVDKMHLPGSTSDKSNYFWKDEDIKNDSFIIHDVSRMTYRTEYEWAWIVLSLHWYLLYLGSLFTNN